MSESRLDDIFFGDDYPVEQSLEEVRKWGPIEHKDDRGTSVVTGDFQTSDWDG